MTKLRTTLAALLVGASSIAIALPSYAQVNADVSVSDDGASVSGGVDAGASASGGTDSNDASAGASTDANADASASTDGAGITIGGDTDADVDAALTGIADGVEGTADADTENAILADLEGLSDEDMQRIEDRCDDISQGEMDDERLLEVCNVVMKKRDM